MIMEKLFDFGILPHAFPNQTHGAGIMTFCTDSCEPSEWGKSMGRVVEY